MASALALSAHAAPIGPGGGPGYGPGGGAGPMMGGPGPYGHGGHGPGFGAHSMGGGPGMGLFLSDRMLDRINATAEQRTQLRKITQDAAADMQAQRQAGRALRDQMAQLFRQPTIDARAVEALLQQMLAHHDQASKRQFQSMLDASSVLTAEQRKQVADLAKQRREMAERHWRERHSIEAAPKS